MSWPEAWSAPWRNEREHQAKADQVRRNTEAAYRIADLWTPPPSPPEDENGFADVRPDAVKGPNWCGPKDDEWADGEHWSWLFGDSPWARRE